jgi:hypothetical protein
MRLIASHPCSHNQPKTGLAETLYGVAEIGRVNLGFQIPYQIETATMYSASRLMDVQSAHPRSSVGCRGRRCTADGGPPRA